MEGWETRLQFDINPETPDPNNGALSSFQVQAGPLHLRAEGGEESACTCVLWCANMHVSVPCRKVLVGMTVARDAPTRVPLCLCVPTCLCAVISYLCTMPAWGRCRGSDGVHVYKVASLFVSKWVGVGLGVAMGTGAICLW